MPVLIKFVETIVGLMPKIGSNTLKKETCHTLKAFFISFTESPAEQVDPLFWKFLPQIFEAVRKWMKQSQTRQESISLMASMLAAGDSGFLDQVGDSFHKELTLGLKEKNSRIETLKTLADYLKILIQRENSKLTSLFANIVDRCVGSLFPKKNSPSQPEAELLEEVLVCMVSF